MMNCVMRDLLSSVALTGFVSRNWSNLVMRLVCAHSVSNLVYSLNCLVGPPTDGGR